MRAKLPGLTTTSLSAGERPSSCEPRSTLASKQKVVLHPVLTGQHRAELLVDALGRDVGQEAQPAAIDADHRNAGMGQVPPHAEQAAVAADHDNQAAALAERLPWTHAVTLALKQGGGLILHQDAHPMSG